MSNMVITGVDIVASGLVSTFVGMTRIRTTKKVVIAMSSNELTVRLEKF